MGALNWRLAFLKHNTLPGHCGMGAQAGAEGPREVLGCQGWGRGVLGTLQRHQWTCQLCISMTRALVPMQDNFGCPKSATNVNVRQYNYFSHPWEPYTALNGRTCVLPCRFPQLLSHFSLKCFQLADNSRMETMTLQGKSNQTVHF